MTEIFVKILQRYLLHSRQLYPVNSIAVSAMYFRPRIFQLLREAVKDGSLARFGTGIYFLPTKMIFGQLRLEAGAVVAKKFLSDGDAYYGFYSGPILMNSSRYLNGAGGKIPWPILIRLLFFRGS